MRRAVTPELDASLLAYRKLLADQFGARIELLRLFGSWARGDAGPDSDADVCVVIQELNEDERGTAIDLAFQAWRASGRRGPLLSPLVWSDVELADRLAAERRIARDVLDEGIAV